MYVFFGLTGPLTARYLEDILGALGTEGMVVEFPEPAPAHGIVQFIGDASQIGLLVVVLIAGLLTRDGVVMLTDFGLAMWGEGGQPDDPAPMGTAQYVAPERVITGECTAAGDLWSLGATLYTAVEGHGPYARPSATESLSALVSLPPDPPARAGSLKALLLGLLEREPRLRPTAAETRAMLSRAAANAGRHDQNAVAAV